MGYTFQIDVGLHSPTSFPAIPALQVARRQQVAGLTVHPSLHSMNSEFCDEQSGHHLFFPGGLILVTASSNDSDRKNAGTYACPVSRWSHHWHDLAPNLVNLQVNP